MTFNNLISLIAILTSAFMFGLAVGMALVLIIGIKP